MQYLSDEWFAAADDALRSAGASGFLGCSSSTILLILKFSFFFLVILTEGSLPTFAVTLVRLVRLWWMRRALSTPGTSWMLECSRMSVTDGCRS